MAPAILHGHPSCRKPENLRRKPKRAPEGRIVIRMPVVHRICFPSDDRLPLNTHWLLRSYLDGREPSMPVWFLPVHDSVELVANCPGDRSGHAFADADLVDRADGSNF